MPAKAQLEKSRPLIDRAILLDPESSEAFTALGNWYRRSGEIEKAYQAMGEQESAQALTDQLVSAIHASPSVTYHDSAIQDASIYALSVQVEAAIATTRCGNRSKVVKFHLQNYHVKYLTVI